jgi:hypothetical protein
MTRRRAGLLVGGVAVLLTVLGTVFHSDLIGWWRGEAKYQGRYTNAWRAELRQYDRVFDPSREAVGASRPVEPAYYIYYREATSWERWLARLWPSRLPARQRVYPRFEADLEAIPVFVELLHAPEPNVRALAARGLGQVGPAAHEAVPMLFAALDDEADFVAHEAARALYAIAPQALDGVGLGDRKWRAYRLDLPGHKGPP